MTASGTGPTSAARRTSRALAVVGNGPVGQTTALLLVRWGLPVVLLDRCPGPGAVGSPAICHQRDVLDVWAAVGAGDCIAAVLDRPTPDAVADALRRVVGAEAR